MFGFTFRERMCHPSLNPVFSVPVLRFSTEDVSLSSPEKKPRHTSSRHRNSADWLGLKTDDDGQTFLENKTTAEPAKTPSSPLTDRRALSGSPAVYAVKKTTDTPVLSDETQKQTTQEVSKSQRRGEEEDDWLVGALSRRKALTGSQSEAKTTKREDSLSLEEETVERYKKTLRELM